MELKCYKVDLQKQYKEQRVNTKEFKEMRDNETLNMIIEPVYLYLHYWELIDQENHRKSQFIPWKIQEKIIYALNSGHKFWVNVKSRRMGFTEIIVRESLKTCLLYKYQNIGVLSKNQSYANEFIGKVRNQHNDLIGKADWLRSPILHDNVDMIHFGYSQKDEYGNRISKGLSSQVRAFPKGISATVGSTLTDIFWDEASLQENTHDLFAYTLPCIEGTGGRFIISSTVRGFGNKHSQLALQAYDYWELGDITKKTDFKYFFMGYFDRPDRTQETWNIDLRKIGSKEKTMQEFPRTFEEAFQAGSYCIFDVPTLKYMMLHAPAKPMIGQGQLVAQRENLGEGIYGKCQRNTINFVPSEYGGDYKIFCLPNYEHNYIAGVDGALGTPKGDYTVCIVTDLMTGEQVAIYRSRKNQEQAADDIEVLCKWYSPPNFDSKDPSVPIGKLKEILIIPERDASIGLLQRLKQTYDNIYGHITIDGVVDKVNYQKLGTSTRAVTKKAYLGYLATYIYNCVERDKQNPDIITGRGKWGWIYDTVTLEELLNYVETEEGKLGADKDAKMESDEEGSEKMHDDTVTACWQVCIGFQDLGRQEESVIQKSLVKTHLDKAWEEAKKKAGWRGNKPVFVPFLQQPYIPSKLLNKLKIN